MRTRENGFGRAASRSPIPIGHRMNRKDVDWGDEDFVLIEYSGEWSDAGPESIEWQMARMAIIEKDNVTGKPTQKK